MEKDEISKLDSDKFAREECAVKKSADEIIADKNFVDKKVVDGKYGRQDEFDFSYCAPNSEEKRWIESIRREYLPQDEHDAKVEEIKKLHKKVKKIPSVVASVIGITGVLVLGLGMSLVLEWNKMTGGIIVGLLGMVIMLFTYPIYQFMVTRRKDKYGERIVSLADELTAEADKQTGKENDRMAE